MMAGFHDNGISGWVEFVAIGVTLPLSTIDEVGIMEERHKVLGSCITHNHNSGWVDYMEMHLSGRVTIACTDFKFVVTKVLLVHSSKRRSEHQNQQHNQTRGNPQLFKCRISKPI